MTKDYKILAKNKKALSNYELIETFEAGIKLTGPEVKSVKLGHVKLDGAWASLDFSESGAKLNNAHISSYKPSSGNRQASYDPIRPRILLFTKKELSYFFGKIKEKKLTMIPISVYNKSGIIKVEIALARGKKKYQKRESIKKRDIEREIGRRLKS